MGPDQFKFLSWSRVAPGIRKSKAQNIILGQKNPTNIEARQFSPNTHTLLISYQLCSNDVRQSQLLFAFYQNVLFSPLYGDIGSNVREICQNIRHKLVKITSNQLFLDDFMLNEDLP